VRGSDPVIIGMPPKKHTTIDPIAQFMQDHDEALVHLSALNKTSTAIAENGFTEDAFIRLRRAAGYLEGPTRLMRDDHKQLSREVRRLRRAMKRVNEHRSSKAAARDLSSVSKNIVQLMVNHIHKENHILFPLVQKFLTKDALREIARRMV
jgi:iron-sulfur cluster repair protein YtfE (RIC family)